MKDLNFFQKGCIAIFICSGILGETIGRAESLDAIIQAEKDKGNVRVENVTLNRSYNRYSLAQYYKQTPLSDVLGSGNGFKNVTREKLAEGNFLESVSNDNSGTPFEDAASKLAKQYPGQDISAIGTHGKAAHQLAKRLAQKNSPARADILIQVVEGLSLEEALKFIRPSLTIFTDKKTGEAQVEAVVLLFVDANSKQTKIITYDQLPNLSAFNELNSTPSGAQDSHSAAPLVAESAGKSKQTGSSHSRNPKSPETSFADRVI